MKKIGLIIVTVFLVITATISALWLSLFCLMLIISGGTYSIASDEVTICAIPIFTSENWEDIFYLLLIPVSVLVISVRLAFYCVKRMSHSKLP
ncbi:MAG: hypothetical protein H7Z37_16065 [Pyrinomonadaceae bacterium]|nr:hypothetical protein [Pyrinomonadaceae bacterium]